jgi:mono/diheme cytochrome c family protein
VPFRGWRPLTASTQTRDLKALRRGLALARPLVNAMSDPIGGPLKIYRLNVKRKTVPKIAVLVAGVAGALLVATVNPLAAQATPRASSCAGCHNPASPGVSTAAPSTVTPLAGASYWVAITLAANPNGGNTGYGIVPVAPATEKTFGGNTSAALSYTATMVAPTAAGTYRYTVWTNQGPTDGSAQVGSVEYSITVAPVTTPPVTTPPVTTPPVTTPPVTTPPVTTPPVTTPPVTTGDNDGEGHYGNGHHGHHGHYRDYGDFFHFGDYGHSGFGHFFYRSWNFDD